MKKIILLVILVLTFTSCNTRKYESKNYYNTKDLLFWLVVRFDHGWLKYINNNNKEIFSYIKKNSDLYNLTINFKKNHNRLEEVVNWIELYDIKINGDNAKMYVHERLVRHLDKTPITKSYNWLYKAKRIDGIWYLTEMKKTHKTFHE